MPSRFGLSRCIAAIDWRRWLILAWVCCFGVLYTQMVIKQRGGKFQQVMGARSK